MSGGYPNSGPQQPGPPYQGPPYPGQPYPGPQQPGQQYPGPQQPGQQYPGPRAGQFPAYSFSSLVPVRHWARDPALRSWPVLLLIALVCVPPIALVMLNNATESTLHDIAWIFAAYFAVAWLLLLGVIVRPQHVSRSMLAAIAVIGIVTQAPIAIFLETQLHAGTGSLADVFTIGIPEELAKAIPIVAVAWIWRRQWQSQAPRDYLFLGAVSGLVFGAAEAVHYFNVLGTVPGSVNGITLQGLTIQYIWRFLTDPVDHACWAGITGYFIGLAITGQSRKYSLAGVGIGIAAVLHGLNDWNPINSHPTWVLITLISVLLFLGYARAGALLPHAFTPAAAPAFTPAAPAASAFTPAAPAAPAFTPTPSATPAPAAHPAPSVTPPTRAQPTAPSHGPPQAGPPTAPEPWWQAPPGGSRPAPQPGTPVTAPSRQVPPKPWWEQ
ncbi:MAG: PrsW family glutamic-type intramembrane protease [Streptosporangiaceae bacterium]